MREELLLVKVFIDEEKIEGRNADYIEGKVSGIIDAICVTDDKRCSSMDHGFGRIFTRRCTEDEFVTVKTLIDKRYPGVCKFKIMNLEKKNR